MDFAQIESLISDFLNQQINNNRIQVKPIPEVEADFEKVFAKEVIIVAFSDEEPEMNQKAINMVYQETDVTFAFLLQSKSLRGNATKLGIYALHRLVKKYMIGFEPMPGLAFRYAGFKMQDKADDIFNYAVYFKTKGVAMQETDNINDTDLHQFKEVIFRDKLN